jgi:hypothetical protein
MHGDMWTSMGGDPLYVSGAPKFVSTLDDLKASVGALASVKLMPSATYIPVEVTERWLDEIVAALEPSFLEHGHGISGKALCSATAPLVKYLIDTLGCFNSMLTSGMQLNLIRPAPNETKDQRRERDLREVTLSGMLFAAVNDAIVTKAKLGGLDYEEVVAALNKYRATGPGVGAVHLLDLLHNAPEKAAEFKATLMDYGDSDDSAAGQDQAEAESTETKNTEANSTETEHCTPPPVIGSHEAFADIENSILAAGGHVNVNPFNQAIEGLGSHDPALHELHASEAAELHELLAYRAGPGYIEQWEGFWRAAREIIDPVAQYANPKAGKTTPFAVLSPETVALIERDLKQSQIEMQGPLTAGGAPIWPRALTYEALMSDLVALAATVITTNSLGMTQPVEPTNMQVQELMCNFRLICAATERDWLASFDHPAVQSVDEGVRQMAATTRLCSQEVQREIAARKAQQVISGE